MRNRNLGVALALVLATQRSLSQSVGKQLGDDFKNLAGDMVGVWASPFHASSRDWLITAGSLAAFAASMPLDRPVSDWAGRNDSSAFFRALSPVRRGGFMFSGKTVLPPVAAAYVIGVATKNQDARDFVMGCMSSWGAQSVLRKSIYFALGRARPDTLPEDNNNWRVPSGGSWQMHSFPAGHFANALACASYWNHRFHLGAAGPIAYAFAGAVGIGRIADRGHWTSDTVIGGILGYAVGKEVARRANARRLDRLASANSQLYMAPELTGVIIGLHWTF
jgi:membrane-associated phospholipid phosphatase